MFDPDGAGTKQWADATARKFTGFTGYMENFATAVGQTVDEELSVSSRLDVEKDIINPFTNPIDFVQSFGDNHRNRKTEHINSLIDDGKIDPTLKDKHTKRMPRAGSITNWDAIAEEANVGLASEDQIITSAQFEEARNKELAHRRAYAQDIYSRADGYGVAGQFLGGATAGMALDPVSIVTAPLAAPLTGVTMTSRAMYTASVTARAFAFNAGLQGVVEPFIHSWKEEIGAEYTIKDSMFNMGAAGLFGGTVQGVASNIGFKLTGDSFLSKDREGLFQSFKDLGMDDTDAHALADHQASLNNAPDLDMPTEKFVTELEDRGMKMREGEEFHEDVPSDLDAMETHEVPTAEDMQRGSQMILDDSTPKTTAQWDAEIKAAGDEAQAARLKVEKEAAAAMEGMMDDPLVRMYMEIPEDLTIHIDGEDVPVRSMVERIESDKTELEDIRSCMIG